MNANYRGYFDYASATPLAEDIVIAMSPYLRGKFYNPSALYQNAVDTRVDLENARAEVAGVLGVKRQEIIFSAGCTEANNLAVSGILSQHPSAKVLVSAIEHDSVYEVANKHAMVQVPVKSDGIVDIDQFTELLSGDIVLVSIMYANNEVGTVQPLREIGIVIEKERKRRGVGGLPLYFHTDAAQAANYLSLNVSGLRVDMMSLNGGKVYGPKGSGCLYVASSVPLSPLVFGGGQERGLRSGTENVMGIVGFAKALASAQAIYSSEADRLHELQKKLIKSLEEMGGTVNGSLKRRLPNNINVCLPGLENERVVLELDLKGFMISSGSACHAKSSTPSRVLEAMGLSDKEVLSSIRISMGRYTISDDVDNLRECISQLVAKNR